MVALHWTRDRTVIAMATVLFVTLILAGCLDAGTAAEPNGHNPDLAGGDGNQTDDDSEETYRSLINGQFQDPSDIQVLVVPSVFFSQAGMVGNTSWLTNGDPINDYPGLAAVVEAIEYWEWMLDAYRHEWPVVEQIGWTMRIVGVDATLQDVPDADIVVVSWMANDPAPMVFHLGVGLPYPISGDPQVLCVVYNSGLGSPSGDEPIARLRNLAVHEFGHCISAGHTYDTDHNTRLTDENDVMASVNGEGRQCLSNLNVQSVAEGYAFLVEGGDPPGFTDTTMPVSQYEQRCIPGDLMRF